MAPHARRQVLALHFTREIVLTPSAIDFAVYFLATRFDIPCKPLLTMHGVGIGWINSELDMKVDTERAGLGHSALFPLLNRAGSRLEIQTLSRGSKKQNSSVS